MESHGKMKVEVLEVKKLTMLIAVGILSVVLPLLADMENVGDYTWTYRINGDTVEIYNGYYSAAISPAPTGAVTIPSSLGGKTVTSIGGYAFSGCSGLTNVTIPDSVTSIGDWAFRGCSGLTSVMIPASVTNIGHRAFEGCTNVTDVVVPGWTCGIPFGGVTNLVISDGVTSIGSSAFKDCSGLTRVTIPASVTNIGYRAFEGCTGLASVTIPDSVTCIESWAFKGCSGLMDFAVDNRNVNYSSMNGLLLSKDGKLLIRGINGAVTIPDSVTNIGLSAFSGCTGLTNVAIPNSVTRIESWAFEGCSGLTSVIIPASVTSIGLGGISILGMDNGEGRAFSDCSGLMSFTVDNGNVNYSSMNGLLLSKDGKLLIRGINGAVTIPDIVTSIGEGAFSGCSGLTSVTISDSVTNIGDYAFSSCSGLTRVTIPNCVTSIGNYTFSGCSGLTSVTIPDGVTSIGNSAFSSCSDLTRVTIPNSVTNIGNYTFSGCSGLTSVTIPDGVTSIGNSAFRNCSGMTSIIFNGNAPMVVLDPFSVVLDPFPLLFDSFEVLEVNSRCTAYVREGSTGWGVDIPGTWNGLNIQYLTLEVEIAVASETGTGIVEVEGELSNVEVASGVMLMVKGENLDAAALAAKITPKPHEEGQSAALFKVKTESVADGVSLSVVLDEEEVNPDETAAEIVNAANVAAFGAAADGESVSVSLTIAKPGLYYGIAAASDLVGLAEAAANVSLVRAGDAGATVPVAKPAGGAAFFKVIVSDRAR